MVKAIGKRDLAAFAATAVIAATAGIAHYAKFNAVLAFALAALALSGVAWMVSFGTEELGTRLPAGPTGLLQSTLGNLPELFVVLFALREGQVVVAQTSILGSIFANALLVLGVTIVIGARRSEDGYMRFSHRLPKDTATLLLVATFVIVLIGISLAAQDRASGDVQSISVIGAIVLLAVYAAWVIPFAREGVKHGHIEAGAPRLSLVATLALLGVAGVAAAFVSEWFVAALEPAIDAVGVSEAFAGLVVVGVAGNAVENFTAFVLAAKGRSETAISVVKNSVAQIAAFLFPVLVLVSLAFESHLTFAIEPVYVGALAFTALAVWQITDDGEAAAFEGWALTGLYVILAALTLYE
ncbi:MAG: sodium:proton exchanger [Actinobacteria bacterium]|nr:sodium:proton exchanger [Actinomycetota bacterium]